LYSIQFFKLKNYAKKGYPRKERKQKQKIFTIVCTVRKKISFTFLFTKLTNQFKHLQFIFNLTTMG